MMSKCNVQSTDLVLQSISQSGISSFKEAQEFLLDMLRLEERLENEKRAFMEEYRFPM